MHSFLLFAHLFLASPDPIILESGRLLESADERRDNAHGIADLLRYSGLRDWIPHPDYLKQLKERAQDDERHPLGRAMAWWLILKDAQDLLAPRRGAEAQQALGLMTHFWYRPGPVEAPRSPVKKLESLSSLLFTGTIRLDQYLRNEELDAASRDASECTARRSSHSRLGYSDQITVWWNGDQVYSSSEGHAAWLDQTAILVQMRLDETNSRYR